MPLHGAAFTVTEGLAELALDTRSSWNHATDHLWRQLDAVLWESARNPWVVLQSVSHDRIQQCLEDPAFRKRVNDLVQASRAAAGAPAWFQHSHPGCPLSCVAYFSMEFMLSEALPIYSGGLGNVAGDQLKAASDLGLPVVGVSLLYSHGYFRQVIDASGAQEAVFPNRDPGKLPITPVRHANGERLRLEIAIAGCPVWVHAWQVQVGRVKLYLLDCNDEVNAPAHRAITSELYGGGPDLRLQQEILLGIGGWRLLTMLGIAPEVCHLNEGHAAFAVLERARSFMEKSGLKFDAALAVTRAGNVFTTHTAVVAGFDLFAPALIEHYLADYAEGPLGIPLRDLLALGRQNPDNSSEAFNMACLAVRGSRAVNGVSRLHGQISRRILQPLFPRWPQDEVPVGHVTNGVHMPTWDSEAADTLWTQACGKERWQGTTESLERMILGISDSTLWNFRSAARKALVDCVRVRLSRQLFDTQALTLVFARRFATYKRPQLLLHDPERLLRLLNNPQRPVQIILAGKAHPTDEGGQAAIRDWTRFILRPEAFPHVVFLSDYDMHLTEQLVQGADVWLNTPRRPWEACGTSGMKVLVNGGINLSALDGWWAEAYTPEVGWAIGDGREHGDDPAWDAIEANALYDLLEHEVIPEFYSRDERGIPKSWVNRMRESMARLTPRFSTGRSVCEYTEKIYIPAASAYLERAANKGKIGLDIVHWRQALDHAWSALRFGEVAVATHGDQHVFEIQLVLNEINPEAVQVELYADAVAGSASVQKVLTLVRPVAGTVGGYVYGGAVSAARPAGDYTARVIPRFAGVTIPLEDARILWQR
jgi:starch phosphorylase